MTGMMTGIMTDVAAGVNLVSTTVELDYYAHKLVYPHTFFRHTVGLVCWYYFYLSTRYYRSLQQKFIQGGHTMLCQTEHFLVYQGHSLPFVYTSHQLPFIPVIYIHLQNTPAPPWR